MNSSYRFPFERIDYLRSELADPTSPVAVELSIAHDVLAARRARFAAGTLAAVSTASLQAIAIFGDAVRAPRDETVFWSTGGWVASSLVAPVVLYAVLTMTGATRRARTLQRALAPRGDLASSLARLLAASDPQRVVSRAVGREKASIAAPLVAIAGIVTTVVVCLLGAGTHDHSFLPLGFEISGPPTIVGGFLAHRYAAHLTRTPAHAWHKVPGALGTVLAIAGTMAVCTLFLLFAIPAVVALVAAGIAVPLAYWWARRTIAAERTALGVI